MSKCVADSFVLSGRFIIIIVELWVDNTIFLPFLTWSKYKLHYHAEECTEDAFLRLLILTTFV